MSRSPQPDVVCVGILVADVIVRPVARLPAAGTLGLVDSIDLRGGGCALNTASCLARLGLRSAALGKVGSDTFGEFVLRLLRERGVDAEGVLSDPELPTSASVALVDPGGERTFLHLRGANAALGADELGERPFAEARSRGIQTSVDAVFDAGGRWERLLPALPHCDLVTPGLAEAQGITGEQDPARAARRLRDLGAGVAAVTLGPDGCYVAGEDFDGHVPGVEVQAVDGTGAGDAFAAGFLYGLVAEWPLDRCACFANAAGALATTALGAFEGVGDLDRTLEVAATARGAGGSPRRT